MKTTNTSAKRAALLAVLVLGSGAWLSAQDTPSPLIRPQNGVGRAQELKTPDIGTNSQPMKINKGSSIIGTTVKNQQGEELGKIRDLVIDLSTERVAYAVLGSSTGVFSAEKLHAVPLRAFQPDATGTSLVLNADKAKLTNSVGFTKDNWPAVGTAVWGAEPFWKDDQGTNGTPRGRELYPQAPQNRNPTKEPYRIEPQPKP